MVFRLTANLHSTCSKCKQFSTETVDWNHGKYKYEPIIAKPFIITNESTNQHTHTHTYTLTTIDRHIHPNTSIRYTLYRTTIPLCLSRAFRRSNSVHSSFVRFQAYKLVGAKCSCSTNNKPKATCCCCGVRADISYYKLI